MASHIDVLDIISKVRDLPTLPQVVNHVLNVMDDARSNVQDVAKAVQDDPALTAKILRIANSTFYAAMTEITSVAFAINRMGTNEIRSLVISMGVIQSMKNKAKGALNYPAFWRHCLSVALAAKVVNDLSPAAPKFSRKSENPYFVAGLLHDIGILLLDMNLTSVYADVLNHSLQTRQPLHEVEKRILGADHQIIGAFICEKWHLPEVVSKAAKFHHDPQAAPPDFRIFSQVIHVADALTASLGTGLFKEGAGITPDPTVMESLGLKQISQEAITEKIIEAEQQSETLRLLLD